MGKFLHSLLYGAGHAMEDDAQYRFAEENLSKEQFDKLRASRRRLCVIQAIPLGLLAVYLICVFLFAPAEEKTAGYATGLETWLLFGLAFFVFFYAVWLILSQFVGGGRLWVRYAAWYRRSIDHMGDLPELLKILDGQKQQAPASAERKQG